MKQHKKCEWRGSADVCNQQLARTAGEGADSPVCEEEDT